ncbi:LysR family transcriptional regulator [Pseudooceanicola sp. CBS1P-1]|uniref:LysR family transcriptional regulator n=1 Tax=Pseudooceanicola albus TaxID=2692189 RepID=A0A6L7G7L6_9RHOB|nr:MULTISPECIES: LysR substrate-binding domain-containing protein [Pseudooceanicola]MBT9386031.1 LysR family transcriptional regulator [Pseudooceanicola endophyticus]MXN19548.1 LysR family transcriptional regulator [Pseudooceanicola albus]
MPDLRHYRHFVTLAEELHFGRAATRLGIAQPALSIQIRKLEDQLGGALFRRTQRSVELTEAGRMLLPQARALLEGAARLEDRARRAMTGEIGHVTIGYSSLALLTGLLGAVVGGIRAAAPDLDIRVLERDPVSLVEALQEGRIQLGLTTTLGVPLPETLGRTLCATWGLEVVLPLAHPLAGRPMLEMADLRAETFIVYRHSVADDGRTVIRKLGGFEPRAIQEVSSPMMVPALVAAGFGVSILPAPMLARARDPGALGVPLAGPEPRMDCSLLAREAAVEPFLARALQGARDGARNWAGP